MTHPLDPYARAAYSGYGVITDNKNYQGLPMPAYDDLGPKIQEAWRAAADAVLMFHDMRRRQPGVAGGILARHAPSTEGTPMGQQLTIGRQVHYTLTGDDANRIRSGRIGKLGTGQCNDARAGAIYPATVVAVFSPGTANLTVQLDGPDTYWVTSVGEAGEPVEGQPREAGRWFWPPRV